MKSYTLTNGASRSISDLKIDRCPARNVATPTQTILRNLARLLHAHPIEHEIQFRLRRGLLSKRVTMKAYYW